MEMLLMPEWLRSGLLLVLIVLILTGRRSGAYDRRKRLRADQAGLRAGLLAELTALRAVYQLNFNLIDAGAPQIIPGRPYFSVYRRNTSLLVGLTPSEVASLVTAHAACDTLYAAVQIGMRMRARRSDTALWDANGFDLWRLQRAALTSAEQATAILEAAQQAVEQTKRQTIRRRLWHWFHARPPAQTDREVAAPALTPNTTP